jgi:hypothetical protein
VRVLESFVYEQEQDNWGIKETQNNGTRDGYYGAGHYQARDSVIRRLHAIIDLYKTPQKKRTIMTDKAELKQALETLIGDLENQRAHLMMQFPNSTVEMANKIGKTQILDPVIARLYAMLPLAEGAV